jgi:predicted nucleic-acid-binding protein
MIALDTKVLARAIVEEADADAATLAQQQAARALLSAGQALFLPVTVIEELAKRLELKPPVLAV